MLKIKGMQSYVVNIGLFVVVEDVSSEINFFRKMFAALKKVVFLQPI